MVPKAKNPDEMPYISESLSTPSQETNPSTEGSGTSREAQFQWVTRTINGLKYQAEANSQKIDDLAKDYKNNSAKLDTLVEMMGHVDFRSISPHTPVEEKKPMSEFTREELDAKLARNKAESEAVASSMKVEMANFRTAYVESFSEISKTLSRIESKSDATEKRLTQAQWIVSLVISICAVTLSAVIFFSNKNTSKPVDHPQVVINTVQPEAQKSPK